MKLQGAITAFLAMLVLAWPASAQDRGAIAGRVIDQATQLPLQGAQISVAGTLLGALANQEGRFLVAAVPAGEHTVRVTLIGYAQASSTVTVTPGGTAAVNFELSSTALALEGLVVTAAGGVQRRRELGNTVGTISSDDVELAAVTSTAQMLTARSPGVSVQTGGGTTGGSQRIRVRGSNSVSLSNEPLMIIDGVKVNSSAESMSLGVGGQDISRLNDINPDEIEKVEILKGPAAAALYGTAAANGVIQITTRRGRPGPARWSVYSEGGYMWDPTDYPANYGRRGTVGGNAASIQCTLFRISTGACVNPQNDVLSFAPLEAASPFRDSDNLLGLDRATSRGKYGASVSGGSETLNYFFSGDREKELGIYPNNEMDRVSFRGNLGTRLSENIDLQVSTGWTDNEISLPQNDNNLLGQLGGALLGRPVDDEARRGFAGTRPELLEQLDVRQRARRFMGGGNVSYRPLTWLSVTAQTGLDALFRHDNTTLPANTIPTSATNLAGYRQSNRAEIMNLNAGLNGSAVYALTEQFDGQTEVGTQFHKETFERTDAFGGQLLPGTSTLPGTSARFSVSESFTDNRTIGAYIQQQVSYEDRIFLTAAARGDDNSAFGRDFGLVVYPSVSLSWVIGEEEFFPEQDIVSSLKLRGAWGTSGLRPAFRDAISFFSPVSATVGGTDTPAFTVGGIGDPNLKPEFSTEVEAGFEAGLLNERAGIEVTYYNKNSRDALVFRRLAPSVGAQRSLTTAGLGDDRTGRFENIGKVNNRGWEVQGRFQVLDMPRVKWDVRGLFSKTKNELVELGEGIEPIIFGLGGSTQRHQPGYPLGGYWDRVMTSFNDANNDGIIQHTEVTTSSTPEFLGNPNPGREFALTTNATFFDRVRLYALLDGKGDYVLNNSTLFFRCASAFVNCREAFDPTAPLFDQARAVAASPSPQARGMFFEDASFMKLREVAVTLIAPTEWNNRLRVDGLSLTLSGRNLKTWTDYTGFDPELNTTSGQNFNVADFNTQPVLRYFTARINLTF